MNNIRFTFIIRYILVAIFTLVVMVAVMVPLLSLPVSSLAIDGAITGILLAVLCFLLKDIVRYGKYTSLPLLQRIINYGALGILFIICWVGMGFFMLYLILPSEELMSIVPTLPIRAVLAALVYAYVVLFFSRQYEANADEGILADQQVESLPVAVEAELLSVAPEQEILEHIAVKNGQKIDLIFIQDVVSIQAEGDYVMIFTLKGKFLKEQTMKYFGDHLPKNKFVRVHRSNIVNIDFIQRIELYEKQTQMLQLQNSLQVKMSVAGYKELKKVLNL